MRRYSAKETYNFQAPTHCSHPIVSYIYVSQCVVVRCSALQCVAVRCSALQCVAVRCSALQCVAAYCSVYIHKRIDFWAYATRHIIDTPWRRYIEYLKLQVSFRKRATTYRALLQKMKNNDKAHSWYKAARMHKMPQITGLFPQKSH